MKLFLTIFALASAVVATNQAMQEAQQADIVAAMEAKAADFASLIKEQCTDMSPKCLEIAQDLHQTGPEKKTPNFFKDLAGLGSCQPEFATCTSKIQSYVDNSGKP